MDKNIWIKNIETRIEKLKQILTQDWVVIFSISEESLLDSLIILKKYFKYVFEPLVLDDKIWFKLK